MGETSGSISSSEKPGHEAKDTLRLSGQLPILLVKDLRTVPPWYPGLSGTRATDRSERKTVMGKNVPHHRTRLSLDTLKEQLREKLPELQRRYGIVSMEVFGSWVRGEQTGRSDLDILVEFDPSRKLSLFDFVALEQELTDFLGIRIDLVEKSTIKPALRNRILNEAVPL